MPFSDNLYSLDDDSDNESFSDQLSPSDGYFNRADIPPNIMVPDPSLEQNSNAESKAREAREEAQSNAESQSRNTSSPVISNSTPSRLYTSAPSNTSRPVSSTSQTSQSYSSPSSPQRSYNTIYTTHSPLMAGPPPAYSPPLSSSTPSSPQNPQPSANYNTFAPHRLEDGLSSHAPQSMGAPPDQPTENTPLWTPLQEKTWARRAFLQKLLFAALMISVIIAIPASILGSGHSHHTDNPTDGTPKEPSTSPERPNDPEKVDPPPWKLPANAGSSYCSYATYRSEEATFSWPMDKKLIVKQDSSSGYDNGNGWSVSVTGEIRLRPIPRNADHGPSAGYITSYIYTSHPDIRMTRNFDVGSRTLEISTPRRQQLDKRGPHCISIEMTAWIPEGAEFETISLDTVELTQRVFDGTNIKTSSPSTFTSKTGGIHFPTLNTSAPGWKKWDLIENSELEGVSESSEFTIDGTTILPDFNYDSRHIVIQTVSGSISGSYPLYDYLGIKSVSGSVNIGVTPHKIKEATPLPAQLEIETASSSIKVHQPIYGSSVTVPPRDYITTVDTKSGSVHGDFIIGSKGTFHTESSSIGLAVLPVMKSDRSSEFRTSTKSGSTHVNLFDPFFVSESSQEKAPGKTKPWMPVGDKDPYLLPPSLPIDVQSVGSKIRNLASSHTSISGTVNLQYSSAWEGVITARSTGSGSIHIDGRDIEVISDERKDWIRHEIIARKPKGSDLGRASSVEIESVSGSIHFKA